MASIDILNLENKKVGTIELSDAVFSCEVKSHLLHSAVRVDQMTKRAGNASTKGRSEIRGGGSKPWKQKGTGNARSGTSSSPVWVGGGVAFGPKPKKFNLSLNKKVRKSALRSALSMKFQSQELVVLENFDLTEIKTKVFDAVIKKLGLVKPLIVYSGENENLDLSSRNVVGVKTLKSEGLNVYDVLNHESLVLTKGSVEKIQEALA
ncbi:MAG: 50S ribosomal protein L4 [Proteobacteria bacterium]|nr:50S ribosomal protein L4 [Pseudomonadota bacterium]